MTLVSQNAFDRRDYRNELGAFATGIAIVTARGGDGQLAGLTINSFASVSLEPAFVLWGLCENSPSSGIFETASHFAIHVLGTEQEALSKQFSSPATDRFANLKWSDGLGGAPIIAGCCAVFQCAKVTRQRGGDHSSSLAKWSATNTLARLIPCSTMRVAIAGWLPEYRLIQQGLLFDFAIAPAL